MGGTVRTGLSRTGLATIFLALLTAVPGAIVKGAVVQDAVNAGADGKVDDGVTLFAEHCAGCHNGSVPRAPHFISFNMMSQESLLTVMNEGVMQRQAAKLSPDQRTAVAAFLTGSSTSSPAPVLMCDESVANAVLVGGSEWIGWGGDQYNHRYVSDAAEPIGKADLESLTLKWVFAYPGATRARSQPLVHSGSVYVGSQDGAVYALDLESGCAHWVYQAGAEVRNGPSIVDATDHDAPLLVFGDFDARVHGVNAHTGERVWLSDISTHPDATITGSVKIAGQQIYVPLSSSEWATAADPGYACCTFRGSVAALDVNTGKLLWNSFVIPEQPAETGEFNAHGAKRFGPSGAPVWNTPSIDTKRGLLYVGTGEAYTSPASMSSDAVIAMRLSDGKLMWRKQLLAGDAWNMACFIGGGGNCPEEDGPDLDIGAATILWQADDSELLLVGQKSGDVYGLDLDKQGDVVWHRKLGRGGFAGGVHWGMATNGDKLFVPIADTDFLGLAKGDPFPGMHSLNPLTGATDWYTRAEDTCRDEAKPACDPGMSAAPTSTSELVFAGGFDGMLRAYDSNDGEVLWEFNTFDTFPAVNGDVVRGESIESDGPVLSSGHLLVNSGYLFGSRMPGNALLVFEPSERPAEELASE